MLISIILPTIRAGTLGQAVDAIRQQTRDNWELIVVSQGPDTESKALLDHYEAADERIRHVHVDMMNLSNARNIGMSVARGDIFAFTDDDCEVAPDWIEVLTEMFETHPDVGICGGEVVAPKSSQPWRISTCPAAHVVDAVYMPEESNFRAPVGFYMIGANFCVRRTTAERVGTFDTALGAGAYFACCEDQDFGVRAESMGIGSMTSKRLIVHHTTGRRYGVKQFVKHQRNYALGRGAWVAKLQMWNHRLGDEWSQELTTRELFGMLFTRPHRLALELFGQHYKRIAAHQYRSIYVLGDDLLSHPRDIVPIGPAERVGEAAS